MMHSMNWLLRSVNTTLGCLLKVAPKQNYATYKSSPFLIDLDKPTNYEVTQLSEDWKYVEHTLPPLLVPEPIKKDIYPSGWKPQSGDFKNAPYYIPRNKNHMIPVHLRIAQNGIRRVTIVRKIQGNIWLLEKELREFLEPQYNKPLRTQVNEFTGFIRIYGDHVNAIKYWLMQKNL